MTGNLMFNMQLSMRKFLEEVRANDMQFSVWLVMGYPSTTCRIIAWKPSGFYFSNKSEVQK